MNKLLAIACALALGLVAVGCGSSGGSDGGDDTTTTEAARTTTTAGSDGPSGTAPTAEEYTAAFVENLSNGTKEDGDLVLTEEQATCVAPRFVDAITVEVLQEQEVTVDDVAKPGFDGSGLGLSEEQGEQLVDAFEPCDVDIVALFAESLTMGLTAEQQDCAKENVDPDLTRALLVKTFSSGQSDQEFEAVLSALDEACDLPG